MVIDPYVYPRTNILKNLAGIKDHDPASAVRGYFDSRPDFRVARQADPRARCAATYCGRVGAKEDHARWRRGNPIALSSLRRTGT